MILVRWELIGSVAAIPLFLMLQWVMWWSLKKVNYSLGKGMRYGFLCAVLIVAFVGYFSVRQAVLRARLQSFVSQIMEDVRVPADCERLHVPAQYVCFAGMAYENNDPALCGRLADISLFFKYYDAFFAPPFLRQDSCIDSLVEKLGGMDICTRIHGNIATRCLSAALLKVRHLADDGDLPSLVRQYTFQPQLYLPLCERAEGVERRRCFQLLGDYAQDVAICEKLRVPDGRVPHEVFECAYSVAIQLNDVSLCERLNADEYYTKYFGVPCRKRAEKRLVGGEGPGSRGICSDPIVNMENGRRVLPIRGEFRHLPFLGQIFSAIPCGKERLLAVDGVQGDFTYSYGITVTVKDEMSSSFQEKLQALHFTCTSSAGGQCRKWTLSTPISLQSLVSLVPHASEMTGDDCVMCG